MDKFAGMGKNELRAACKAAGISYGKLNNDGMRGALRTHENANFEASPEELAKQGGRPKKYKMADPSNMTDEEVRDSLCPGCGVHLSNGLLTPNDEVANKPGVTLHQEGLNRQYHCMGCGHEFGAELEPYVKPQHIDRHTGTGLKIEKARDKRNGVTRPSAGGKCREIWDFLDSIYQDGKGTMPTAKLVKEQSESRGWNANNASIEFYQWRKFQGIAGRQK